VIIQEIQLISVKPMGAVKPLKQAGLSLYDILIWSSWDRIRWIADGIYVMWVLIAGNVPKINGSVVPSEVAGEINPITSKGNLLLLLLDSLCRLLLMI